MQQRFLRNFFLNRENVAGAVTLHEIGVQENPRSNTNRNTYRPPDRHIFGEPTMNFRLILMLGMLIAIIFPAGALSVGVSSVGGPPYAPTENVSYYISDARAAVNEQNWISALLLSTRGLAY